MFRGCGWDTIYRVQIVGKPVRKNGRFRCGNWKLVFRAFTPHGSKEKIQGTYFKICLTYFKISQTYFLPPENCIETCPENADKTQTRPRVTACAGMNRCLGECKLKIPQPFAGLRDSCVICRGCPYLTRTFCLPTMYMPFARPLVALARATLRRMSTPSML